VFNVNSTAHFRTRIFRSGKQFFLHNLVVEGKQS
jgi:hypothetical protein